MTPEEWGAIKEILNRALDLPEAERASFLAEACAGDTELEGRVASLIEADERTWSLLESPAVAASSLAQAEPSMPPGERIGAYEIVDEIGHGGMGVVYLARRADEEFDKRVAIKTARIGLSDESFRVRFRTERQIVAGLDHPNIARLLDGGTSADGQPYLVMEYVEGEPLLEFCRARGLATKERLEIFLEVCAAVQYAHQHLIVHRDIKPSNILVTKEGTVKLLDFGIAKLIAPEPGGAEADRTGTLFQLLTPDYASPEQLRGEPVTTASDVYALGVVLYELLTGQKPYRVVDSSPADMIRIVCDTEPQRPSAAVLRGGEGRSEETQKLRKALSGDLDTIVLKAMRKEPARRYASVSELAADIRRHLEGHPVSARRDSVGYRAGKFVRRHRAAMAAASIVLVALVAGLLWNLREARRARAAEARAERRFAEVRKVANSYLFELHDAIKRLPGSTPARALLVRRALQYLDGLAREEGTDVSLRRELAEAYQKVGDVQAGLAEAGNLGDTAGALRSYRKALAIREALVAGQPENADLRAELAAACTALGSVQAGAGDYEGGIASHRRALRIREELLSARPNDANRRKDVAISYFHIGDHYIDRGDFRPALESHRKALATFEGLLGEEPSNVDRQHNAALARKKVGAILEKLGDLPAAAESYQRAVLLDRRRSEANPLDARARLDLSFSYGSLGGCLASSGDYAAALENYGQALAIRESLLAADPKNRRVRSAVAWAHARIGYIREKAGDPDAAGQSYREAFAIYEALSKEDPAHVGVREEMAALLMGEGDVDVELASAPKTGSAARLALWSEARSLYRRSLEIWLDLRKRGVMKPSDAGTPDQIASKIARCDQALDRR
ncbi:MAG TPA: protein kinase [Thermoanaerobaculia bacterium]|nr:protein kinase [Thermoanaerobaculia bacterium]